LKFIHVENEFVNVKWKMKREREEREEKMKRERREREENVRNQKK